MKTALITGVTGQDGSYLAELLLDKDYKVYGLYRRSSSDNFWRLKNCLDNFNFSLLEGDLTDPSSINGIVKDHQPNEIYNLAAQSHVATSFSQPSYTFQVNFGGVLNILEAVRQYSPESKLYQASTSEMYGSNYSIDHPDCYPFQDEKTEFKPNSPYAVAKLAAHNMIEVYRKSYNLFCCSGVLFNHESPRRGGQFVTQKIIKWLKGDRKCYLELGNLNATRDWGHAKDYVKAMWTMLQNKNPTDYVVATGEARTVKDFLDISFSYFGLDWNKYVRVNPQFFRPCEVPYLRGRPNKIKEELEWKQEYDFKSLIVDMIENEI